MGLFDWLRRQEPPRPPAPACPSPVPWVDDAVWAAWAPTSGPGERCPIQEPRIVAVNSAVQASAARMAPPAGAPVPPAGDRAEQERRLAQTPPADLGTWSPLWPLCCARLCALLNAEGAGAPLSAIEAQAGPLTGGVVPEPGGDDAGEAAAGLALLARLRREGSADGMNIFHCRSCGRIYLAPCHP